MQHNYSSIDVKFVSNNIVKISRQHPLTNDKLVDRIMPFRGLIKMSVVMQAANIVKTMGQIIAIRFNQSDDPDCNDYESIFLVDDTFSNAATLQKDVRIADIQIGKNKHLIVHTIDAAGIHITYHNITEIIFK